jgi:hypothetical protein
VLFDDPTCDCKPESGASEFPAASFICTVKTLKNFGLIIFTDANS